ncbi:MAG: formate dehydrogenase accessory sulfurtransferase FdhD [Actinomycetota bacterium]
MVRSRSFSVFTRRFDDGIGGREPDELVVEEPMTIRLDDQPVASTMRTPGHDFELAAGFLLAEGMIEPGWITGIRYCGTGSAVESEFNVVSVETGGRAPTPTPRLGSISASCGLCGSEAIEGLTERLRVLPAYEPWDLELLVALPDQLRAAQTLFDATGAVHAAAAFDRSGRLLVTREDIGRHNAVDKVTGRLLLDGKLPSANADAVPAGAVAPDLALVVSGRASFEMVQKAWVGGYTALVAVSAPSALAVTTARRAGLTVVGFARGTTATIYSPAELVDRTSPKR